LRKEALMDKYVWVEVLCSDRLPKTSGDYLAYYKQISDVCEYNFNKEDNTWRGYNDYGDVSYPVITGWLEQKPIEEVIKERMPTEEEIFDDMKKMVWDNVNDDTVFESGFKYLRDKLLKQD
jgi:hypothetical protein